jgi:predicted small metal-binding protein
VFEFVCERLIPGCTAKVHGEDRDEVIAEAERHLQDRHDRMPTADLRTEIDLAVLRLGH